MENRVQKNSKATASMVLGIIGVTCCPICGLIGLIFAIKEGNKGNTDAMQTVGMILGIISTAVLAILFFAVIIYAAIIFIPIPASEPIQPVFEYPLQDTLTFGMR